MFESYFNKQCSTPNLLFPELSITFTQLENKIFFKLQVMEKHTKFSETSSKQPAN